MINYKTAVFLFGFVFGLCCCSKTYWESDLMRMRISGELRKACSKAGNAIQPRSRVNTTLRVAQLRELMVNEVVTKGIRLDAYIIPSHDEHQSEFVAEYDSRREYISGFSGSYGDAVVTAEKAVLWTDGRYHLQADDQLDCNWLLMRQVFDKVPTMPQWLHKEFPRGAKIGVDPKLLPQSTWEQFSYTFRRANLTLVEIETNLIDKIWTSDRPPKRNKDAFVLDDKYTGKNWTTKLKEVRMKMANMSADAMVVTALDEIAWLLNIRGRDIPYSPFVRSYVILDMHEVRFFVNRSQLVKHDVFRHFNVTRSQSKDTVRIVNYEDICTQLKRLSQAYQILIPSQCVYSPGASHYIHECVPHKQRLFRQSPIIHLKAKKNPTESAGMYNAHVRDAAAMCDFFSYFETRFKAGTIFTELEVVKILNEFRFEQKYSLGNSFRTIAAFGSNGALPHYEPTFNTNAKIFDNSTLVLDSGGQYYDGTTDVTRTLHFGTPTKEQKEAYTRVLIGQIQLTTLTFPENLKTSAADVVARAPLWEIGLDYLHGTSHGVGSFLSVHESPISMNFDAPPALQRNQELKPGYFLSNEPGLYREGEFGIRLENVMEVVEKKWLRHSAGRAFLGFKVVTLVPYEPKLLDLSLLSVQHRRWLNSYNENIRIKVGAELKRQKLMNGFYWMMEKTNNIPEYGRSSSIQTPFVVILVNVIIAIILN